jgi:hypothetical protein
VRGAKSKNAPLRGTCVSIRSTVTFRPLQGYRGDKTRIVIPSQSTEFERFEIQKRIAVSPEDANLPGPYLCRVVWLDGLCRGVGIAMPSFPDAGIRPAGTTLHDYFRIDDNSGVILSGRDSYELQERHAVGANIEDSRFRMLCVATSGCS